MSAIFLCELFFGVSFGLSNKAEGATVLHDL